MCKPTSKLTWGYDTALRFCLKNGILPHKETYPGVKHLCVKSVSAPTYLLPSDPQEMRDELYTFLCMKALILVYEYGLKTSPHISFKQHAKTSSDFHINDHIKVWIEIWIYPN